MKIGILTFHASHNYGSMLQAYALQRFLKNLGHEVETINLRNERQKRLYNYPLFPPLKKKKRYLLSFLNPLWLYREIKKWYLYESFLSNYLSLTKREYHNWEEIVQDIPNMRYDILITGGDQIWNMRCKDFDKSYYLPSKLDGIRKISYSPSFGRLFLSKINDKEEKFVIEHLSDYYALSVREDSMRDYLSTRLHKNIDVATDPTLLLDKSGYMDIIDEKPIVEGKYIYYYSPFERPHAEKLACLLGKHYGMKVVTSFPHIFCNKGLVHVQKTGPLEFLNLLSNATLVVGMSFHLVVFSLIFHKDFIAINGDSDARMKYLLKLIGNEERGMVNERNYKTIEIPDIDFHYTDEKLKELSISSISYIQNSLNRQF